MEHIKQTQGLVESFPGYVLRMRGLPYSATPDDVVSSWFLAPFVPCHIPKRTLSCIGFCSFWCMASRLLAV